MTESTAEYKGKPVREIEDKQNENYLHINKKTQQSNEYYQHTSFAYRAIIDIS